MAGYIKLYRGWRDCNVFSAEKYSERDAWVWLLENAAWKDTQRRTGNGSLVCVARGQMHSSLRNLGAVWGWPKSTVERYIARLETGTMVVREAGHCGMIITICNYEKYQGNNDSDRDSLGTSSGTVAGQSRDTQEEGKEREEEKNKGGYAFEGRVIKLNDIDLARWKSAYALLDIKALLQSRDDWISSQPADAKKRWFQSTSNWLAKQQQAAAAIVREEKRIKVGI